MYRTINGCKRGKVRRIGIIAVLLLTVISMNIAGVMPVYAAANQTVRVGWFESPFNFYDENGMRSGYAYEYQQKIASYTGWDYDYVSDGWYDLLQDLKKGEIDVLADVSRTPAREKEMLFSAEPMGTEHYYIVVPASNTSINDSVSSLNGKRIGVSKGSVQEDQFRQWEKEQGVAATIMELEGSDEENIEALENGDFDGYLCVGGFEDYMEDGVPMFMVGSSDYYFAINKDHPELKQEIDAAMLQIQSANWFYTQELAENYFKNSGAQLYLTESEQQWIQEHGSIRVGYLEDYMPFSDYDYGKGRISGILRDFISYSEHSMKNADIYFETIPYKDAHSMYEALSQKKVDCIFPISISTAQAEELHLLRTDALVKTEAFAVVPKKAVESFDPSEPHSIAVLHQTYEETGMATGLFPGWKQIPYESLEEELDAVVAGKVDCLLISNYQSYALRDELEKHHLATIDTGKEPTISFGAGKDSLELYSVLNKLTQAMPEGQVNTALARYTIDERDVTLANFMRAYAPFVVGGLTLILLIILYLLIQSRRSMKKTNQLNQILRETERKAEEASQAKTNFLFNMSHDIRTPMNAIVGYTDMAIRHQDDPKMLEDSLGRINLASEELLQLINDILDMSRIESGKMEVQTETISLQEAMAKIDNIFAAQAREKNIEFRMDYEGIDHDAVWCDIRMLNRILMNLISNAIKFTPGGGTIAITAEEMDYGSAEESLYRFRIEDNGIGMSKEFQTKLFEPFERERTSTVSRQQGTGLGMSIVKNMITVLNGSITVDSEPDRGTVFTVELPMQFSKELPEICDRLEAADDLLKGKVVLLVEDIVINRELAKIILEDQEMIVDTAENGQIAVDMFRGDPARYDAILMDIQMPVLDGYQATQAIRSLDLPEAKNIAIIAMTANAFEEDKQNAIAAGMNDHVSKPINIQQLNQALLKWMR